jgi:type VI secretion system protein ImpE
MEAADLLKQGKLDEALSRLQEQIRNDPSASKHRVFLFQLLCISGRWDKALTQLNLVADLDAKAIPMAQVCRHAIQCEAMRAEVYGGKRTPLVFGQPQEWVAWLLQSLQMAAQGNYAQAKELRAKAFEAAPAVAGTINGTPFQWLADADPRLGPVLEALVDGKYFWIPMCNIAKITIEAPTDLRDVIWTAANFTWTNGGAGVGFIPGRYPGTESAADPALLLGRKTDWQTLAADFDVPLGQRLLVTDVGEYPLLEVRQITFAKTPEP